MADDKRKKDGGGPDEAWVDRLGMRGGDAPAGVTVYVGLLRRTPGDEGTYQLYVGLDMRVCLYIPKEDVVHWEDLPPEQSPFGNLGGSRVYVRDGARVKSVTTTTSTFEAGAADEFDLDIRLGAAALGPGGGGFETIPETGCGAGCGGTPFTTPHLATCGTCPRTICLGCGRDTINTCPCVPTQGGKTCGQNCQVTNAATCVTNCGTCQTCQTQCGTCATNCGTCNTNCGTCKVNTCSTKCGQETCAVCTHRFTECNQNTCNFCQTQFC